jgi:hypothetical protein
MLNFKDLIQKLWIMNVTASTLVMHRTYTYSSPAYYNPYSVFKLNGGYVLTAFRSQHNSKLSMIGVDQNTFIPDNFIKFILDPVQLTVSLVINNISTATSVTSSNGNGAWSGLGNTTRTVIALNVVPSYQELEAIP